MCMVKESFFNFGISKDYVEKFVVVGGMDLNGVLGVLKIIKVYRDWMVREFEEWGFNVGVIVVKVVGFFEGR